MLMKCTLIILAVSLLGLLTCPSWAGWTFVDLNPAGCSQSNAAGVSGGRVVGWAPSPPSGNNHAGVWSGTAASWQDQHPADYWRSFGHGIAGNTIGGWVGNLSGDRACTWNISDGTRVDLGGSFTNSYVFGIAGNEQVGQVITTGYHAALWRGTAGSFVDLNPAGAAYSDAVNTSGEVEVGAYSAKSLPGKTDPRACMWRGDAGSFTSLHPAGHAYSSAYDASGDQQVGMVDGCASLWTGLASSWVNLNPAGCSSSEANGVSNGVQVGDAQGTATGNSMHAIMWTGTADSWFDLHSLLPAGYAASAAMSVDVVGDEIWVAGNAGQNPYTSAHAVLWHYTPDPLPEPASLLTFLCGVTGLCGIALRRRK